MPRINLLPWREELRRERQQQFMVQLGLTIALGAAVVLAANINVRQLVQNQEGRNNYLRTEIQAVDKKIQEIQELQSTKQRLIARMQVIEQLQKSRPEIVHLFDEMVRTLPNGAYLESITQKENVLEIRGVAESSARVSAYMRNIEASPWLQDPKLARIETSESNRIRRSVFSLSAKQESETNEETEE